MNAAAPDLDADARERCAVAAALLHGGRALGGLALLAGAGLLLAVPGSGNRAALPGAVAAAVVALLLLFVERYLALRVALDARLFDRLASGRCADLAMLDRALQQVLRVPAAQAGRALDLRIQGAQRLLHLQALAAAGLCLLVLLMAWPWRA